MKRIFASLLLTTVLSANLFAQKEKEEEEVKKGFNKENFFQNKIGFSVLASAVLMNILKKQRDAVGLSVFSDTYEYYSPEKGSDRHHRMILNALENLL